MAKRHNSKAFNTAVCRLRKMKGHECRQAISMANNKFIRQFCSEVKKLRSRKLPTKTSKKLKSEAKSIRKLLHKKTSVNAKRKMLSQRGGFLTVLLAALAPVLGSALGGIFGR